MIEWRKEESVWLGRCGLDVGQSVSIRVVLVHEGNAYVTIKAYERFGSWEMHIEQSGGTTLRKEANLQGHIEDIVRELLRLRGYPT